ncbi:hypothetical protein [Clostridium sp. UBA5712]|uniref:hypothetical protein n=1 Tax=Clostridium sp. UBA5712 TaxID=1946368 RepID=UPI00321767C3
MYCVIQEVDLKKEDMVGGYKGIEVYESTWTIGDETKTKYCYSYTGGRFERPIKKAYKISIHHSYRDNGKVKKKQWVICTIGYYSILECWPGDCIIRSTLNTKLEEMGIDEDKLWDMVYVKFQPIIDRVTTEYEATEEYKVHQEHRAIIDKYNKTKNAFESVYGDNTYDYCYDVFGQVRNEKKLQEIKEQYKQKREYQRRYYENYKSNYDNYDFSGYFKTSTSTYTEEEKAYLKKIYKAAAMKLHPDTAKDGGECMKFLNNLKEKWGM